MDLSQIIWALRIIGGLAIGFFIARKCRDFIRSIVIMCIPLKHRISERSFQIQTRITTIVGILLAIGIALGLNYGLSKAMRQMNINQTTTFSEAGLSPKLPVVKKPKPEQLSPITLPQIMEEEPTTVITKAPLPTKRPVTIPPQRQAQEDITTNTQVFQNPYPQTPVAYFTPTSP